MPLLRLLARAWARQKETPYRPLPRAIDQLDPFTLMSLRLTQIR